MSTLEFSYFLVFRCYLQEERQRAKELATEAVINYSKMNDNYRISEEYKNECISIINNIK